MVWHHLTEEFHKPPKEGYGFIYQYIFENGKSYIGHTRYSVEARHCKHKNIKNSMADRAISEMEYTVRILEEVPLGELSTKEVEYIRKYNTIYPDGYNKALIGNGHYHSEETKEKIRKYALLKPSFKGHKLSYQHRLALYNSKLYKPSGFKGRTRSDEKNKAVSLKLKGHSKFGKMKIKCVETGEVFESIGDASKKTGINRNSIGKAVRGVYETAGMLHWERCEN